MENATYFMVGAVAGFWLSVLLFSTLIYKAAKDLPKSSLVKNDGSDVQPLYSPKENN